MSDRIPLPRLPAELRRLGLSIAYRTAYNAALDARIPAEVGPNGRWSVNSDDLPEIAKVLAGGPKPGTMPALAA
jgi:hypothetical protein